MADIAKTPQAPLPRRLAWVLVPTYLLVLLSFALPTIPLDGSFAALVLRVADSATWEQLPLLCMATLILLTSRPGPNMRKRVIETGFILAAMVAALAGNALLNESVVKPAFHVPRPNIVALTQHHALEPAVAEPHDFYALGDKQARRDYLAPRLAALEQPALGPKVRAHWIHETGYSFPSGHATASMTFATLTLALGMAWLHGWRQWITAAMPVWALGVVYSRPLLQVHTPTDVSVGALLGIGWGLGTFVLVRWLVEHTTGPEPRQRSHARATMG
ncbi:Phosphatidylglycerophosphatase B [Enhygromyxa salina]|uniref:Phosphatidylglycerophosphatase B n=1 Tax=Enhygromyxa salina TaxID=215803 RepID=A0A0C2D0K4_9BACT|nr:phosphatase PAP2 family protein [Enhygromyxa salina]KIG13677.1 Phosphatidylglycerophosphatase B [Enhygromyxa salina]